MKFSAFPVLLSVCLLFSSNLVVSGISGNYPSFDDSTSTAAKKELKIYNTKRLSAEKPLIDGVLNDNCWEEGQWQGDFIQFIPVEGGIPTYPTKFKVLYDDKNIYVAIRAFDPEISKVHRFAGLRDEFQGDMMGINFDSYHDHRTGFEFNMTAYGQKIDLILSNPLSWDVTWNPVWTGKTALEDSAWTVEMEIPLSQLRYSSDDDQVWGMHVWRWIGRLNEESDWEYQTLTGPGAIYNFGELRGIKNLQKSKRLEVMPYVLGNLKTFSKEPGNPFTENGRQYNGNLGLDVKLGISSNFTLDMTVNPDFGQVESDPSEMNLTAFETFYEEKRPFFLEAKNIFKYKFDDLNLFYSRRIGHAPSYSIPDSLYSLSPNQSTILSAFKLSGKTSGGLSVGLLQSLTGPEYAEVSDMNDVRSRQKIEPLTNYVVARVQQDYNQGSTVIGGILTSTNRVIKNPQLDFLAKDAYSGGMDLLHQWKEKKYYIDTRLVGSYVNGNALSIQGIQESSAHYFQRPDNTYADYDTSRTMINGLGGAIKIGKGTGLWRYSTSIKWLSPGLELNDIGYMQYADLISNTSEISYFVVKPVSIFRTYTATLSQFNNFDFSGTYLESGGKVTFESEFLNKWGSYIALLVNSNSIDNRILRGGNAMKIPGFIHGSASLRSDYARTLSGQLSYYFLKRAENSDNYQQMSASVSIRPVNTLRISTSVNYTTNKDALQYITKNNVNSTILGKVNQNTLGITFRLDYSLTPDFSLQYYGSPFVSRGIYSDYKEITDPMANDYNQRFTHYTGMTDNYDFNFLQFRSNFVAKWEYRPGSFLYLVWSDERTGNTDPSNDRMFSSMKKLFDIHSGNLFLIKFNYWFSL